jgi:hypothetical protein
MQGAGAALYAAEALRSDAEAAARVRYRQSRLADLWDIAAAKDEEVPSSGGEGWWREEWERQIETHRYSWRW